MGTINSKSGGDGIIGRQDFLQWSLPDVRAAFLRAVELEGTTGAFAAYYNRSRAVTARKASEANVGGGAAAVASLLRGASTASASTNTSDSEPSRPTVSPDDASPAQDATPASPPTTSPVRAHPPMLGALARLKGKDQMKSFRVEAISRVEAANDDTLALWITRRQFWEIFTDYAKQRDDGSGFLSLPISLFSLFVETDSTGAGEGGDAAVNDLSPRAMQQHIEEAQAAEAQVLAETQKALTPRSFRSNGSPRSARSSSVSPVKAHSSSRRKLRRELSGRSTGDTPRSSDSPFTPVRPAGTPSRGGSMRRLVLTQSKGKDVATSAAAEGLGAKQSKVDAANKLQAAMYDASSSPADDDDEAKQADSALDLHADASAPPQATNTNEAAAEAAAAATSGADTGGGDGRAASVNSGGADVNKSSPTRPGSLSHGVSKGSLTGSRRSLVDDVDRFDALSPGTDNMQDEEEDEARLAQLVATERELRVNALEILLLLVLFCKVDPATDGEGARERAAFELFDSDVSGSMSMGEMMVFLQTLTRAVYRVGITRRIPAQREVYSLARAMFLAADSNRNGKLSCDEFCAWAKHHVASQRLLTSFQRERELDGADADLAVSVPDDGEAVDAADGPQRNLILAQLAKERQEELLEGASSPRLSTNAMYRTSMAVARMRKRLRGGADAAASAVTGKELQDLRAKLVLLEQQAVASQDVMAALQSDTKFDMSELRRLRDRFVKVAKGSKELSRKQFVAVLTGEYKTLRGTSVSNLFDAFDLDGNGSVSFQELTMGLNRITKGTVEDKIKFMFSVYDIDGDGGITTNELAKFVAKDANTMMETSHFAEECLAKIDHDGNGVISEQEFVNALKKDPLLMQCFSRSMLSGVPIEEAKASWQQLESSGAKKFDLSLLQSLWRRCALSHNREMNKKQFRQFMMEEFKCPPDTAHVVNRIFDIFDTNGDGAVDWQELFAGISQFLGGDLDSKAAFYFSLFDVDGSGAMDQLELESMLYSNQRMAQQNVHNTASLLKKLDADGDGMVTVQEFQAAIRDNPTLLNVFGRVFGVDSTAGLAGAGATSGLEGLTEAHRERVVEALATELVDQHRQAQNPRRLQKAVQRLQMARLATLPKRIAEQQAAKLAEVQARAVEREELRRKATANRLRNIARLSLWGSRASATNHANDESPEVGSDGASPSRASSRRRNTGASPAAGSPAALGGGSGMGAALHSVVGQLKASARQSHRVGEQSPATAGDEADMSSKRLLSGVSYTSVKSAIAAEDRARAPGRRMSRRQVKGGSASTASLRKPSVVARSRRGTVVQDSDGGSGGGGEGGKDDDGDEAGGKKKAPPPVTFEEQVKKRVRRLSLGTASKLVHKLQALEESTRRADSDQDDQGTSSSGAADTTPPTAVSVQETNSTPTVGTAAASGDVVNGTLKPAASPIRTSGTSQPSLMMAALANRLQAQKNESARRRRSVREERSVSPSSGGGSAGSANSSRSSTRRASRRARPWDQSAGSTAQALKQARSSPNMASKAAAGGSFKGLGKSPSPAKRTLRKHLRYVASLSSLVTRHHAAALGASLESSVAALKEEIRSSDSRLGNLNHTHYDVLNGSSHSEQRARARRYRAKWKREHGGQPMPAHLDPLRREVNTPTDTQLKSALKYRGGTHDGDARSVVSGSDTASSYNDGDLDSDIGLAAGHTHASAAGEGGAAGHKRRVIRLLSHQTAESLRGSSGQVGSLGSQASLPPFDGGVSSMGGEGMSNVLAESIASVGSGPSPVAHTARRRRSTAASSIASGPPRKSSLRKPRTPSKSGPESDKRGSTPPSKAATAATGVQDSAHDTNGVGTDKANGSAAASAGHDDLSFLASRRGSRGSISASASASAAAAPEVLGEHLPEQGDGTHRRAVTFDLDQALPSGRDLPPSGDVTPRGRAHRRSRAQRRSASAKALEDAVAAAAAVATTSATPADQGSQRDRGSDDPASGGPGSGTAAPHTSLSVVTTRQPRTGDDDGHIFDSPTRRVARAGSKRTAGKAVGGDGATPTSARGSPSSRTPHSQRGKHLPPSALKEIKRLRAMKLKQQARPPFVLLPRDEQPVRHENDTAASIVAEFQTHIRRLASSASLVSSASSATGSPKRSAMPFSPTLAATGPPATSMWDSGETTSTVRSAVELLQTRALTPPSKSVLDAEYLRRRHSRVTMHHVRRGSTGGSHDSDWELWDKAKAGGRGGKHSKGRRSRHSSPAKASRVTPKRQTSHYRRRRAGEPRDDTRHGRVDDPTPTPTDSPAPTPVRKIDLTRDPDSGRRQYDSGGEVLLPVAASPKVDRMRSGVATKAGKRGAGSMLRMKRGHGRRESHRQPSNRHLQADTATGQSSMRFRRPRVQLNAVALKSEARHHGRSSRDVYDRRGGGFHEDTDYYAVKPRAPQDTSRRGRGRHHHSHRHHKDAASDSDRRSRSRSRSRSRRRHHKHGKGGSGRREEGHAGGPGLFAVDEFGSGEVLEVASDAAGKASVVRTVERTSSHIRRVRREHRGGATSSRVAVKTIVVGNGGANSRTAGSAGVFDYFATRNGV